MEVVAFIFNFQVRSSEKHGLPALFVQSVSWGFRFNPRPFSGAFPWWQWGFMSWAPRNGRSWGYFSRIWIHLSACFFCSFSGFLACVFLEPPLFPVLPRVRVHTGGWCVSTLAAMRSLDVMPGNKTIKSSMLEMKQTVLGHPSCSQPLCSSCFQKLLNS